MLCSLIKVSYTIAATRFSTQHSLHVACISSYTNHKHILMMFIEKKTITFCISVEAIRLSEIMIKNKLAIWLILATWLF